MDRIQAMQVFVRVAEAGSFIQAAQTLSLPASTVTSSVKNLEKYLQVRLLNRTTRRVSLTPEGARYLTQCREILELIEHTETSLTDSIKRPQGRLRVDMPGGIAHSPLIKTAFFASDPNLGHILAAIGYAGIDDLDVNTMQLYLGDVLVAEKGSRAAYVPPAP